MTDLAAFYRAYIDCLNRRDWDRLGDFVDAAARHNGREFGLAGYRAMLEQDVREIPDLRFVIGLMACDPPLVAARLDFTCSPRGRFLDVDGRTVSFSENVFYEVRDGRIVQVWSVIDRAAIEDQL
ncbi:ester cyclase [Inquilinus limosus]|uniref:Ester cyclase n=1 Tax=Inquilinus limosus TaxID=171674 RepID=A0A211ZF22_9PROT|nr:ester cyclase [Inquilinus limosus]OWJ63892.1 ester cyclase [Inquilinus limosus]